LNEKDSLDDGRKLFMDFSSDVCKVNQVVRTLIKSNWQLRSTIQCKCSDKAFQESFRKVENTIFPYFHINIAAEYLNLKEQACTC
jgi:hypothetical protein